MATKPGGLRVPFVVRRQNRLQFFGGNQHSSLSGGYVQRPELCLALFSRAFVVEKADLLRVRRPFDAACQLAAQARCTVNPIDSQRLVRSGGCGVTASGRLLCLANEPRNRTAKQQKGAKKNTNSDPTPHKPSSQPHQFNVTAQYRVECAATAVPSF